MRETCSYKLLAKVSLNFLMDKSEFESAKTSKIDGVWLYARFIPLYDFTRLYHHCSHTLQGQKQWETKFQL